MTREAEFLAALAARPFDLALRDVYADWLEERGDERACVLRIDPAGRYIPPATEQVLERVDRAWLAVVDPRRTRSLPVYVCAALGGAGERALLGDSAPPPLGAHRMTRCESTFAGWPTQVLGRLAVEAARIACEAVRWAHGPDPDAQAWLAALDELATNEPVVDPTAFARIPHHGSAPRREARSSAHTSFYMAGLARGLDLRPARSIPHATELAIVHACGALHDLEWWRGDLTFRNARAVSLIREHAAAERRAQFWDRTLRGRLARATFKQRDVEAIRARHEHAIARSRDRANLMAGLAIRARELSGPAPDYGAIARSVVEAASAATLAWYRTL